MPNTRADRLSTRVVLSALVVLVLVAGGCSRDASADQSPAVGSGTAAPIEPADPSSAPTLPVPTADLDGTPPLVEGLPVPTDLDAAFTKLLDQRARALLDGDRDAFLDTLERGDEGFLTAQEGYYDNLVQLPLAELSYAIDPASLVRGGRGYSVVVEISMQLDGFDALASRTLDRFRFDRVGKPSSGRYELASVTDSAWEERHHIQDQPWESRPIQVRSGAGVLVILDDTSVAAADLLLGELEQSVADVAARVPYGWDGRVVVYALSDTAFIRSLDDLPGDDPEALDGISFTVPAGPGDPRTAATRIVLNPRILTRSTVVRERLLRHELTHVAVGGHDDSAPVWLSEGLAEWVSVQALPERQRQIGTEALDGAVRGVDTMPDDADFNDTDAELHYAVAWWVCEYLATTYGDSAPWSVLDAFAAPGTPESPTIQTLLQISVDKLAKRGAALLVKTYAPEPAKSGERGRKGRDDGRAGAGTSGRNGHGAS